MKKDFIVRRSIIMIEGKPFVETYSEQELIRCKDCKHAEPAFDGKMSRCKIRGLRKNDWFCADGERKEGR